MALIISSIPDAMLYETWLPYVKDTVKLPFRTKGKAALDVWKSLFQRNFWRGSQQQMKVIGHDHKCMQQKSALSLILQKHIDSKLSHAIGWKNGAASSRG